MTANPDEATPLVVVFAPSPLLTITVEADPDAPDDRDAAEIHLHGGSQGMWVARMLVNLGVRVRMCAPLGGETGDVLRGLIEREGVEIREIATAAANGAYVHDRRGGERSTVAVTPPPVLQRHELDELYNLALVEGLEADAVVIGGPDDERVISPEVYRRLAKDLRGGNGPVVVDLAGDFLREAVAGGVTVAKVSHEDLLEHGQASSDSLQDLRAAMRELADAGAGSVVVSRAEDPTLVLTDGQELQVEGPNFEPVDHHGAGDSLTAGITVGLARGAGLEEGLRLGTAAGALNATRRGLATGERELIERLAKRVTMSRWDA